MLQLTEKPVVVLRGGFGVYFDHHSANLAEVGLSQPPFATLQIAQGASNGPATLQSPFVPLVQPASSYPIFVMRTPTSTPFIQGTDPNVLDGRTDEYNLNLQYALGKGYLLETGYVGTRSVHRPGQIEFDQALLASPANPINGQTTNSVNNVTARMPIQGLSQGSLFTNSNFIANYNSLQISITKRMEHGFQIQGSYVWSKNLDEVNGEGGTDTFELQLPTNDQRNLRESSYGLAGDDRDQRAVVNFTWAAPRFTSLPTVAHQLLTDWVFSGIGVIQSGAALSIFDSNAGSVYGNFNNRAESYGKQSIDPWVIILPRGWKWTLSGCEWVHASTRGAERNESGGPGLRHQRCRPCARTWATQPGHGGGTDLPCEGDEQLPVPGGVLQPYQHASVRESQYQCGLWRSDASESNGERLVWPDYKYGNEPTHYPVRG